MKVGYAGKASVVDVAQGRKEMAEWFIWLRVVGTMVGLWRLVIKFAWFAWAFVWLCKILGDCM